MAETGMPLPVPKYRHVLVPLDGSDLAAEALPTAAALARGFGADVQGVTVVASEAEAEEAQGSALEVMGASAIDGPVIVTVADDVAAGIVQTADDLGDCLVCLSTHGRGRIAGAVMGSVARAVLQAGRAPIVAVGPRAGRDPSFGPRRPPPLSVRRLVACVDGGPASERVLPVAAGWAEALDMALTIVTVAEPSPPPVRADATWRRNHGPQGDAELYVDTLAAAWKDHGREVSALVVYDPISPAEGIKGHLDAEPAGLVAVTTHARTGVERIILGAGAASIVHGSTAPVLVVPLGD